VTAFNRLALRLPLGSFGRGVATLVLGTGIGQAVVILSSPVLTRLYSPSAYGVYAVALSILSILLAATCLRYESAIPLPEDDLTAANVLALSLTLNVAMSVVAGALLWVAGKSLLAVFNAEALEPYVLLLSLGQLGGGAVIALTSWAVRTKAFSEIAATRLTQSGGLVTVQVGLGVLGLGAPGLFLGDLAGRLGGFGRLSRAAWRTHGPTFRMVTRAGIWQAAQRYRRFPIFSGPSALLNVVAVQAPLLLLVAFYGIHSGGQYALADRVCSLPLTLVAGAVGQVYLAEAARLAHGRRTDLRALFRRTTWSLARMAIIPAILLAVAAPIVAGPLFGDEWGEMGLIIALLVPMFYLAFVMTATGETLYVLERQDLQLVREILRFVLLGGAIPLASALDLSLVAAVAMLSVAGCATYAAYGLLSWHAITRRGGDARPAGANP
jgi:O-antigen/teichoic acid export membrane protein